MSKRKFNTSLETNNNSKRQKTEEQFEDNQQNLNVGKTIILRSTQELSTQELSTQELSTQELRTLFLYAAIGCNTQKLEECLNKGININYKGRLKKFDNKMIGPTPILTRVLNSDNHFNDIYRTIKFIIDYSNEREQNDPNWKKLNIDLQSSNQDTILHSICKNTKFNCDQKCQMLELILLQNPNPTILDRYGNVPHVFNSARNDSYKKLLESPLVKPEYKELIKKGYNICQENSNQLLTAENLLAVESLENDNYSNSSLTENQTFDLPFLSPIKNDFDKVMVLTEDQELSTQELRTSFLCAAISCDINKLEKCLNKGMNINYKGRLKKIDGKMVGPTPILTRLLNSDNNFNDVYEAMKFIIDYSNKREQNDPNWKKLNIDLQGSSQDTILHSICKNKKFNYDQKCQMLELILLQNPNPTILDRYGNVPHVFNSARNDSYKKLLESPLVKPEYKELIKKGYNICQENSNQLLTAENLLAVEDFENDNYLSNDDYSNFSLIENQTFDLLPIKNNINKSIVLTVDQELRASFLSASIECDRKKLEECLNKGININYKGKVKNPAPILMRVLNSNNSFDDIYKTMKFIIDYSNKREQNDPKWKKLNIDLRGNNYDTILHSICKNKKLNCDQKCQMLELILPQNPDPKILDRHGKIAHVFNGKKNDSYHKLLESPLVKPEYKELIKKEYSACQENSNQLLTAENLLTTESSENFNDFSSDNYTNFLPMDGNLRVDIWQENFENSNQPSDDNYDDFSLFDKILQNFIESYK